LFDGYLRADVVVTTPLLWSEFTAMDFGVEKNSNVSFAFSDASSEKMVDRDRCPGHSPQENIDSSSSSSNCFS
jgi:hypothetical protein